MAHQLEELEVQCYIALQILTHFLSVSLVSLKNGTNQ